MSWRPSAVLAVIVLVTTLWTASTAAQTPAPGTLTGQLPASGGLALAVWSGGPADALGGAADSAGCLFRAVWLTEGTSFIGWVRGAPAIVNQVFVARFPGLVMPAGPVIVVCAKPNTGAVTNRTIGSCPLFPDDNPWAADISNYPVHSRSAEYINYILASGGNRNLHADFGSNPDYGIPFTIVPASQPGTTVMFDYADESDAGPYPIPDNVRIEVGSDRHALIVREGECRLYELFALARAANGWQAGSGAVFDLQSNALRPRGWTSADAAGLPILPGLVRLDEVRTGAINHALRFTVSRSQHAFIEPARHYASSITDPNAPPMGLRLRLRADYDISRFRGQSRVVLETLRRYGMFVADNGANWYISGATEPGWDDEDLNQLKTVPGSAFEAVETGPIVTSIR